MRKLFQKLAWWIAIMLGLAGAAVAQTDTSYFVGAIPKAGITALGSSPAVTTIAASGAAQALAFPAYGSVAYDVTLTANCTFSVTGGLAGQRQTIYLTLRNPTGAFTTTLPTVKWSNGTALTIVTTAGTVTDLKLTTTDGGTTLIAAGDH